MITYETLPTAVLSRLSAVRLLLMDVDGVLTNGKIVITDQQLESKQYSSRDGLGIILGRRHGLTLGVISGRTSPATDFRCRSLKFNEIHLGRLDKLPVLEEISQRTHIPVSEIAYIGDDLVDLPVMKVVGISACPSDAHEEVLSRVDIVLGAAGGDGCVRMLIDFWLKATGKWETVLEDTFRNSE
jgi:3-deoxy-D-manno-octulosonate 8-phosphate phosphatase (KDO 8-P phosphatase)